MPPRRVSWRGSATSFPDRADNAQQELEATDRRRANYIRRFYNQDWSDHRLYQLLLELLHGFSGDDWRDDGSGRAGAQRQRGSRKPIREQIAIAARRGRTAWSALFFSAFLFGLPAVATVPATIAVRRFGMGLLVAPVPAICCGWVCWFICGLACGRYNLFVGCDCGRYACGWVC